MKKLKKVAIIGANKEGLGLLPYLLKDGSTKVELIVDPNREAMAFKLEELGYRFSSKYDIRLSSNLKDLETLRDIDVIINASPDPSIPSYLSQPAFRKVEILSPLSAKLLWRYAEKDTVLRGKTVKERHANLLNTLAEILDAVRLTMDKKELLSLILRLAMDTTGADKGSLLLLGKDGRLRVEVAQGIEEEVVRKINIPLGEGIAGHVAKEGKPIIVTGKAREDRFKNLMERSDVKSAMCVPLKINGKTIGVLNVSSSRSTHIFTQDDLDFLTSLATFDAEIIQRSKEYEDLKHTSLKFETWKEVEAILRGDRPLEEKLKRLCRSLTKSIPGTVCSIFLVDEYSRRLHIKASSLGISGDRGHYSIDIPCGINGWVAREKKVALLVDRDGPPGTPKKVFLSIPLVANNNILGIMEIQAVSETGLLPYQETLLTELAGPISEAISEALKDRKTFLHSTKLAVINEIGLEIVSLSDEKKLPTMIASSSAVIMDAGGSVLRLRDNGGYRVKAIHGLEEENRGVVVSIEQDVSKEVLKAKRPVTRVIDTPEREKRGGITSILSWPIKVEDQIVGIITLFDKVSDETFIPAPFNEDDIEIFGRFVRYVEKALTNIYLHIKVKELERSSSFGRAFFERRVKEELNRSRRYGRKFTILILHLPCSNDTEGFIKGLKNRIEGMVRGFDVVERIDGKRLGILFPDSDEGVLRVMDQIQKWVEEGMALRYGYALYPDDGVSFQTLMKKAMRPL